MNASENNPSPIVDPNDPDGDPCKGLIRNLTQCDKSVGLRNKQVRSIHHLHQQRKLLISVLTVHAKFYTKLQETPPVLLIRDFNDFD